MLLSAHSVALHAARTSAEFAALISALDTDLNAAIARKAELEKADDKAIFGDGDLAEVRDALANCNSEIALYEKAIGLADERRIEAARNEAAVDIEALGKDAKAKAADLSKRWKKVYGLIEQARAELFECDALRRSLIANDGEFEKARRPDLRVNLTTLRREAMAGPRASIPARLSRPAIQADALLLSFLSLGGPLDNRSGIRAQTKGVPSNADYRHQPAGD
ncbi:MAG: hypothetical protein E5X53_12460 [Mesorhizobium sp.]|nr:hypothetical protein [Mesorhizobium sp.]TIP74846.1 MAG: hypothetical protein E5X55_07830 [Mesorhizobium sp.]TIQ14710.1 MAG: hypothetical protein E5X57_04085 [Mesorhizobium sp.]TIR52175.1 MAG: hypothetical protein E5X53_12460 [Mesorhizobium sp.]TJV96269.1 MAG: hypothetical protein E5X52_19660 [Mesorhizobium sp.]